MADRYSMKDAAKKIGVHYMTLYRWEKAGRIPPPKRIARTNARIYMDADIAFIKEWAERIIDPSEGSPAMNILLVEGRSANPRSRVPSEVRN